MTQIFICIAAFVCSVLVTLLVLATYRFINSLTALAEELSVRLFSRARNDKKAETLMSRADVLLCRGIECIKSFEQLGADIKLYLSEIERERLHAAANRGKFVVPPDVAKELEKQFADLDRQAKIEPNPETACNQSIHPLPEEPEPRKD